MTTKVSKVQLKKLIKQCIVEVLRENPTLGKSLVKEAIVDMFGERMLMGETGGDPRRRPRKTNVPAMMQQQQRRHVVAEEIDEPKDLFEWVAADTMLNTIPDQIAEDRSGRPSRGQSWSELAGTEMVMDDGPGQHLRQAAMMPDPLDGRRQMLHRQQLQNLQSTLMGRSAVPQQPAPQMMSQQPYYPAQPSPIGEPSQAQIKAMYMAQQAGAGMSQQSAPQVPVHQVPDDLAMIGLGDMNWDHHMNGVGSGGGHGVDLAAMAAAMNAEFANAG